MKAHFTNTHGGNLPTPCMCKHSLRLENARGSIFGLSQDAVNVFMPQMHCSFEPALKLCPVEVLRQCKLQLLRLHWTLQSSCLCQVEVDVRNDGKALVATLPSHALHGSRLTTRGVTHACESAVRWASVQLLTCRAAPPCSSTQSWRSGAWSFCFRPAGLSEQTKEVSTGATYCGLLLTCPNRPRSF